jgi:hypothetical protein
MLTFIPKEIAVSEECKLALFELLCIYNNSDKPEVIVEEKYYDATQSRRKEITSSWKYVCLYKPRETMSNNTCALDTIVRHI